MFGGWIGGAVQMFTARAAAERHPGLVYEPTRGETYQSHREWAGAQPMFPGWDGVALSILNPILHHCRIGKITLKGK